MGISAVDLVRCQIAIALWDRYAVGVPDAEMDRWHTVGDVIRSMVNHAEVSPGEPPMTEAEALQKLRRLIADGWDIPHQEFTPEDELFGARLQLHCRGWYRG